MITAITSSVMILVVRRILSNELATLSKASRKRAAGGRRLHTSDQGRSPMATTCYVGARVLTRFGRTHIARGGQNEQRPWGCMTGHVHPRRNAAEKSRQTCPPARQILKSDTKARRNEERTKTKFQKRFFFLRDPFVSSCLRVDFFFYSPAKEPVVPARLFVRV